MTSLITALMLATQLNVADAKPAAHHNNRRARAHQNARPNRPAVRHAPRGVHRTVVIVRPRQPAPPPRAHGAHHVHWHNGYWVRPHRNPAFIWRWNANVGRWTVVFRF